MLERINKRPEHKVKKQSNSEAAKIARYNMKLLESIYQAYEPNQADNVVKIFRKGGVFSVEPIMEEDFEESFESGNQDIESQGTTGMNTALIANGGKDGTNKDVELMGSKGKQGLLWDIKEENSLFVDNDDDEKRGNKEDRKGENNSELTGYDFDKENLNDIFGTGNDEDNGFNALAAAGGLAKGPRDKNDLLSKNKHNFEDSSSEFEDESNFEGITMNERGKKKRRRRRKKKAPKYNAKIRQLEAIYNNGEGSAKVSFK